MEQFLKATGMRKVFMGVYFGALNGLLLYWKVLPPEDYKVVMLTLIAGFFGANMFERKTEKKQEAPK